MTLGVPVLGALPTLTGDGAEGGPGPGLRCLLTPLMAFKDLLP